MLGDVLAPYYTTERMGTDFGLYISPEHRTGMTAFRMVKEFEKWCTEMGASTIRPGVSTGSESAVKLYKALGYESVGELFMKKLEG
jgi:GNAT superfamily N-acetyltransferase